MPRFLSLLRNFFPSWRFFEKSGDAPTLYFRVGPINEKPGPWEPFFVKEPRGWASLFLNAEGNLKLANKSLVERLLDEVAELNSRDFRRIEALLSYELVVRMVRLKVESFSTGVKKTGFQFKISHGEDLLVSPALEA